MQVNKSQLMRSEIRLKLSVDKMLSFAGLLTYVLLHAPGGYRVHFDRIVK